ncbi:MAG: protein translocase subunit SecD [Acidobacteriota bacterium]|nr:MAG: protein translocase subunit SecD [Acidobacteriota bacterium]
MTIHREIRWRVVLIVLVIVVAAVFVTPPDESIRLGLDLRGGTHLRFEVRAEDAVTAEVDQSLVRLRDLFRDNRWEYETIERPEGEIDVLTVEGVSPDELEEIDKKLRKTQFSNDWQRTATETGYRFQLNSDVRVGIENSSVEQALITIRNRVDEYGVTEPTIRREGLGGRRIVVQLPGVDDPERAKALVKRTAYLEWKLMRGEEAESRVAVQRQWDGAVVPEGIEILEEQPSPKDGVVSYFPVDVSTILTGRDLMNARPARDELGLPSVSFTLNPDAADRIRPFSQANIGERLAIILDGKVISAPVIRERLSGSNVIEGNFSQEDAQDLAIQLRAGALPATLLDLEERSVGPSLGADSIRRGVRTGGAALLAIFVLLIFYYRLAGANATICLLLNLLIIFGALALVGATLTLPGVAGIVLTIGMAVDANIIIFERIKEERGTGKTPRAAVSAGFERAFTAILDSNLTTILACLFLFQFGTGPIKGFAVTMIIGLAANLFTAIFVSRTLFEMRMGPRTRRVETLSI